ncbi:trace amine-associated receptor 4-like [Rhinophrynus dorsalis]
MLGAIILTIVGNLVVIISVSHFKQLHTPTNFLILSLAITDFLLGLMVMPYSMVRSLTSCWYFGDLFCKLHSCFDMTFSTTSIFHLFFISVDRYYAVCQPLHYYRKITSAVIQVFIFVSWAFPCVYAFGLLFSNAHTEGIEDSVASGSCTGSCFLLLNKLWATISSLLCFFIPGNLIITIYIHIFTIAKKQAMLIHNHLKVQTEKPNKKSRISLKIETKAAKTLSIVMGTFILCWLPFSIVTIVDPYLNFTTSAEIYDSVLWLGYFNSALNPIIYALFYPWFQNSLRFIITGTIFNADSSSLHVLNND